jgi:hypothetical protein
VGNVVVVGLDAVDDGSGFAVLAGDLNAELNVGALIVVGEHLPDVVEKSSPLGQGDVQVQLGRHHPGEPRHFLGVVQNVLAV